MKITSALLALFMIITLFISCGQRVKTQVKTVDRIIIADQIVSSNEQHLGTQEYYYAGPTEDLYAGATLNQESFFTKDNIHNFDRFAQIGHYFIGKKRPVQPKVDMSKLTPEQQVEALEVGNESEASNIDDDINPVFSFIKDNLTSDFIYQDTKGLLQIYFKEQGSLLVPYKVKTRKDNNDIFWNIDVIHYSLSSDKKAFSLLVRAYDSQNRETGIVVYTFSLDEQESIVSEATTSNSYYYLLGPTKKAILQKNQSLNICTDKANWLNPYIFKAFDDINAHLPPEYLGMKVLREYPPFSDVEIKCIYVVEDYLYNDVTASSYSQAAVYNHVNVKSQLIVDSDMFIYINSWKTYDTDIYKISRDMSHELSPSTENELVQTITHELGHMIGLDHVFNGDNSIMSYEDDMNLTSRDIDALGELYGEFK